MCRGVSVRNCQFSQSASGKVGSAKAPEQGKPGNSIFIPAKEVLSLFSVILKSREVDRVFGFDDTYYDLAKALRISPSCGRNYTAFTDTRKKIRSLTLRFNCMSRRLRRCCDGGYYIRI